MASFDSAAAMLISLGACLRGEDFPIMGAMPGSLEPAAKPFAAAVNTLPEGLRESVYTWSGRGEGIPAKKVGGVNAEDV